MCRTTRLTTNLNSKIFLQLINGNLLASLTCELLEPFYMVSWQCSKNNALLTSLISNAAVLRNSYNNIAESPPGQSNYTTMEKNIKKAFEKTSYTTKISTLLNLHHYVLLLLTLAFDPRYGIDLFLSNLRQKVLRLLKWEVKKHSCRETV